jgi:hypothetical protein
VHPDTAIANERGTWTLQYICSSQGISAGGGIRVQLPRGFAQFSSGLQISDSTKADYVRVWHAPVLANDTTLLVVSTEHQFQTIALDGQNQRWVHIVNINVPHQNLSMGDTLNVMFGASEAGKILPPKSAFTDSFLVVEDVLGTGQFVFIDTLPTITVHSSRPSRLDIYASSIQQVGAVFNVRITAFDVYYNIARDFSQDVTISSTDQLAVMPSSVSLINGTVLIQVTMNTPGVQVITAVADVLSGLDVRTAESNPILVEENEPEYRLYWGDLHSHSKFSADGIGTSNFAYARDVVKLDFYSPADHHGNAANPTNPGITSWEWDITKRLVREYNNPGPDGFVTFLGYEFSNNPPSGHNNIYFSGSEELLDSIPLWGGNSRDVLSLWDYARTQIPAGVRVFTAPHHTGINFGNPIGTGEVTFTPPYVDTLRTSIEIFSNHGSSELYNPSSPLSYERKTNGLRTSIDGPHYAQDAWALGVRMGTIASSDDHMSQPGKDPNGLVGVWARSLNRDSIAQAMIDGRSIGTTGNRMILDFKINNQMMGSQNVVASLKDSPRITVSAYGKGNLRSVEVLKWNFNSGPVDSGHHPEFEVVLHESVSTQQAHVSFYDLGFTDSCVYYVRVKHANPVRGLESWAWSSPIWVRLDTLSLYQLHEINDLQISTSTNQVVMVWRTRFFDGLDTFYVERGTMDSGFQEIGFVLQDVQSQQYVFSDLSPYSGVSFYRLKQINDSGLVRVSDAIRVVIEDSITNAVYLSNNYPNPLFLSSFPNPSNPGTMIEFYLPKRDRTKLSVYNLLGQKVASIIDYELDAGKHTAGWNGLASDGHTLASGIYFFLLETPSGSLAKKMVLLK